jgi:hypothetical protein
MEGDVLGSTGAAPSADAAQPVKTRVFLSYSRNDGIFVRRIAETLAARGYEPDFDQSSFDPANIATGISAEDDWWRRLQDMIAAADVTVFVVSPDSAASEVCRVSHTGLFARVRHFVGAAPAAPTKTNPYLGRAAPNPAPKARF